MDEKIKKLENDLKRSRKKEGGEGDDAMVWLYPTYPTYERRSFDLILLASQQEEPSFPLVDVPDADVRKVSSLQGPVS